MLYDPTSTPRTSSNVPMQETSVEVYIEKYAAKDQKGTPVETDIHQSYRRVAKALAASEKDPEFWENEFYAAMAYGGATPAGRIMSNAGVPHRKGVSLINCVVSETIEDSIDGINRAESGARTSLAAGCGIGYEFSTLRPKHGWISGVGAATSGAVSFMHDFDSMCFRIASAGGRRGAQMATFDVCHPEIYEFIKAKRADGALRQFNLSVLITDAFVEAVRADADWKLVFPMTFKEIETYTPDLGDESVVVWREWPIHKNYVVRDNKVACKVYNTVKARHLWDTIMASTYDFAEPGFILIDKVNKYNNLFWLENIRATNPCGE